MIPPGLQILPYKPLDLKGSQDPVDSALVQVQLFGNLGDPEPPGLAGETEQNIEGAFDRADRLPILFQIASTSPVPPISPRTAGRQP